MVLRDGGWGGRMCDGGREWMCDGGRAERVDCVRREGGCRTWRRPGAGLFAVFRKNGLLDRGWSVE